MNWTDVLAALIFLLYVYEDFRRGFLRSTADLIGMVLAFIVGLNLYAQLANILSEYIKLAPNIINPLSFLIIWLGVQLIFFLFSKLISYWTPQQVKDSTINKALAIVPSICRGIIFIGVIMILLVVAPLDQIHKTYITDSYIGGLTVKYALNDEDKLEKIFGNPAFETLAFAANHQSDEPMVMLGFNSTAVNFDPASEQYIFSQINIERQKVGLNTLASNPLLQNVARAHSRDMLLRGYFSHDCLDGKTQFNRMVNANVAFAETAENIALAPTAPVVETGLMNSPKHKQNILDPSFNSVGVGVIDTGGHGLLVTEDFTN